MTYNLAFNVMYPWVYLSASLWSLLADSCIVSWGNLSSYFILFFMNEKIVSHQMKRVQS